MKNTPTAKLFVFIVLVAFCAVLSVFVSLIPPLLNGSTFQELMNDASQFQSKLTPGLLRFQILLNQLVLFLLPVLLFCFIFYKRETFEKLDLQSGGKLFDYLIAIFLLISVYPIVNVAHHINSMIPLTEWMKSTETQVSETIQRILQADTNVGVGLNILLIALTPAICEELVFRGMIQRLFYKIVKTDQFAIWIAALLFSLIHFQFEGFFARLLLGAALGYAYYWSKNLWIPIFIHFCNNAFPIIVLQFTGDDLTQVETSFSNTFYLVIPFCFLGIVAVRYYFLKTRNEKV